MEIELCGYRLLIDESDYDRIIKRTWRIQTASVKKGKYYFMSHEGKHSILLHRFIMGSILRDGKVIDHINGNTLDNRKCNLRTCTMTENSRNRKICYNNKTGYKGVYYVEKRKQFRARIMVDKKRILIGCFKNPEDAYQAYCEAAVKYHGEFAHF